MLQNSDSKVQTANIQDIEYLICHMASLWRRLIGAKIKSIGISITEKRVLFAIARHPGLTQVQMANLLELEPQNLIRSLDRLENLKWIEKRADPKDRRVKCLTVTPEAQKVIEDIQAISDTLKPQILGNLKGEELEKMLNNLVHVRENLLKGLELVEEG